MEYIGINSISEQTATKYLKELKIDGSSHPEKLKRLRQWLRKVHLDTSAFMLVKFELQDKVQPLIKIITDAVIELL